MSLRGQVGAAYNLLPNDPQLLTASSEQLLFADYYKKQNTDMMFDRLAKLLGVKYTVGDLKDLMKQMTSPKRNRKKAKADEVKEVFFPLAILLNPQVLEVLKGAAKGLSIKSSSGATDLSAMDPELYRKIMGRAIENAAKVLSEPTNQTEEKAEE